MGANTLNKNKRKKPSFKQSNWCLYQYLPIKKAVSKINDIKNILNRIAIAKIKRKKKK
jgi:hypothetical protein